MRMSDWVSGVCPSDLRLAFGGRRGDAPLSGDAEAVRIGVGGSTAAPRVGLALGPAALALKQPDGETRLDLTELTAEAGRDGLRGSFGGASGRIANVPLRLDQAEGRWTYGGGVLGIRREEDTPELQSVIGISSAVLRVKNQRTGR